MKSLLPVLAILGSVVVTLSSTGPASAQQACGTHEVATEQLLKQFDEKVIGLRAGGDDYLGKPYAFSELLARIEGLARRHVAEPPATRIAVGDLEINLLTRTAKRGDTPILLQPREFKLLEYLMRNANNVVTRTMLLENVWDYHFDPQTNVIDVHISRLRTKIDKGFERPLLHTVRGAGYRLSPS